MVAAYRGAYIMSEGFYRAFEEKFRGSQEVIKSRLRIYYSFIEPMIRIDGVPKAIDLGCGRGEWLMLLKEWGVDVKGVDIDEEMLAACLEQELNVEVKDAISALKELPDSTLDIISGFHIAEHLQFSELQSLVQDALRVLKPAGLLILETPNPENIIVGTRNFYLDPTHQRPLPSLLLSFIPEYYGFARIKTVRLQEPKILHQKTTLSLNDVFSGVSPDYAVIAQKAADQEKFSIVDNAFEAEYGLSLDVLTARYDSQLVNLEARIQLAEQHIISAEARLTDVLNSTSWRVTEPLRFISLATQRLSLDIREKSLSVIIGIKNLLRAVIYDAGKRTMRRPVIQSLVLAFLNRLPMLKNRLRRIIFNVPGVMTSSFQSSDNVKHSLSPRATIIYTDLKQAVERRKH